MIWGSPGIKPTEATSVQQIQVLIFFKDNHVNVTETFFFLFAVLSYEDCKAFSLT